MIPDHELDRYRKPNGDLPGVGKLTARVRAEHPDWDTFRVYDYARQLYAASADRIRAETDAINARTQETRAKVDELRAQRRQASPEKREPEPRPIRSQNTHLPLLEITEGGRATVNGESYDEYLVTTRPIELSRPLTEIAMLVPREYEYPNGSACQWTILYPATPPRGGGGGRKWRIVGGASEREVYELRRLDRLDRSPEDVALLARLPERNGWYSLARVTIDVPACGIRPGDVLIRYRNEPPRAERIGGHWFGLSLVDYETLRDAAHEAGDDALRDITPRYVGRHEYTVHAFVEDSRKWGHRLKRWHSRLFVVRPFATAVSAPIKAISDEGAIFELLAGVGCRMPLLIE